MELGGGGAKLNLAASLKLATPSFASVGMLMNSVMGVDDFLSL